MEGIAWNVSYFWHVSGALRWRWQPGVPQKVKQRTDQREAATRAVRVSSHPEAVKAIRSLEWIVLRGVPTWVLRELERMLPNAAPWLVAERLSGVREHAAREFRVVSQELRNGTRRR